MQENILLMHGVFTQLATQPWIHTSRPSKYSERPYLNLTMTIWFLALVLEMVGIKVHVLLNCLNAWNVFHFAFILSVPATTSDKAVFSFYPNEAPCKGFEGVLARYKEIVPHIHLAGTNRKKMYIRCFPVSFSCWL